MWDAIERLDSLFKPSSVAVIGASERAGSVGRTVFSNLLTNPFGGCVYPVNPKRKSILGVAAFPSVSALPEQVDLAVIVTPAPSVPELIHDCADAGIPAAIIISAGFKELGEVGQQLEDSVLKTARESGMRIIGPNCLGVMNPIFGLNATFAKGMAAPGKVAFISQSGALCTAILDWSLHEQVGFSGFVSLGSMLDVGWGDLIEYFGRDPRTSSILLYMETIGDARSFLSAARDVALAKPIIVIKGGRSEEASKAAASHTGSLAGSDMAFDAGMRRVGAMRVERISELFSMAEVLAKQPIPKGPRLMIVTNAGGPGVLATDALVEGGGKLAELSPETMQAFNEFLPPHWSRNNPVDILGDADPERYARALEVAAESPQTDGLLIILTPQDMTEPLATAEHLRPLGSRYKKPILASWMGHDSVEKALEVLNRASIPMFPYPDMAARAFNYLWQYNDHLKNLYETPALVSDCFDHVDDRRAAVRAILEPVREQQRSLLTEEESKRLLSAYDIPVVRTEVAESEDDAAKCADELGFPVVLKLNSRTITHKTDVGGVQLNLQSAQQVREAFQQIKQSVAEKAGAEHFQGVSVQPMITDQGYELILGSTVDAQFGPIILFGLGGQLVEVFRDRAVGLPPLNATLARRLMERTKIFKALLGIRGRAPIDLEQLERVLIGFGNLLIEQPLIAECDINPLLATPGGVFALDARVVLQPGEFREKDAVRPAIRPYPEQYVCQQTLKSGDVVTMRPIRLEDEPAMVHFHQSLSADSVRKRYFQVLPLERRTEHGRLIRICFTDFDRDIVLVAAREPECGESSILGVARLSRFLGTPKAEFAVLVSDQIQGKGLGTALLRHLLEVGRHEGVGRVIGSILPENTSMQNVCKRLGFELSTSSDGEVHATFDLSDVELLR